VQVEFLFATSSMEFSKSECELNYETFDHSNNSIKLFYFRTRGKYGEDKHEERFTYHLALVFVQCIVNYIYALVMSKVVLNQGQDRTKSSYYAICSLTYLVAMVSSNKALMWVNYPTQVILLQFFFGERT
jgi:hypothetical protein